MQYRKLGTTDIEASVIGFGAWAIGGWMWGGADEKDAEAAVSQAIDQGVNLLDTAPMYGYGRSEEIVGRAIRGRRHEVVLATKCGLAWSENDWPKGKGELHFYGDERGRTDGPEKFYVYKYLRAEAIQREVEASLARLKTDHIDLYQTHWQDGSTPIEETMTALVKLQEQGKIRAIGVSNASIEQIAEYEKYGKVDVDQEKFSMLDRRIERGGYFDECGKRKISLLAYSPLANGLLTGRMDPDRAFGEGDLRKDNPRFQAENVRKINDMLGRMQEVAGARGLTAVQLVIAWTAARYEKMHVLCGARRPEQVEENAKAGDVTLSAEELQAIDQIIAEAGVV